MSKKPERLVMAYDTDGQLVPTPESETHEVPICPTSRDKSGRPLVSKDGGTPITPRVARFFCRNADELPDRLVSIERKDDGDWPAYWCVTVGFRKPFVRFTLDGKTCTGDTRGVCVFNEADARDPYFAHLSAGDRALILARLTSH